MGIESGRNEVEGRLHGAGAAGGNRCGGGGRPMALGSGGGAREFRGIKGNPFPWLVRVEEGRKGKLHDGSSGGGGVLRTGATAAQGGGASTGTARRSWGATRVAGRRGAQARGDGMGDGAR